MVDESETTSAESKILAALGRYTNRSGYQIAEMTGLSSGSLYVALMALERSGHITSEWEDMPPPRRRRYRLAQGSARMEEGVNR